MRKPTLPMKEGPLKLLTKIVLVQWYRIDALDIPIVGNVGIVGDTGTGKSALLDAVQTVLTGGNKNRMVLNRGSNEQSSRKLYEYVLGFLGDPKNPDLEEGIRHREKANCYLGLNFYDQETEETSFVGLCIYASAEEMDDRIEGLFIAPGLVGTKDLFLEPGEGDAFLVLPWVRAKERLEHACPHVRFHKAPGKYTDDLYAHLSQDPFSPNDPETVMKALRAAFRLDKISDPSAFIREYMLDREDLQIQELQDQLNNYRFLAEKTLSVSERIEELTKLEGYCIRVEEARVKEVLAEWVRCSAQLEAGEEQADPLREALGDLTDACEAMENRKATLSDKHKEMVVQIGRKRAELETLDVKLQRERINLKIEKVTEEESKASGAIAEILRLLERLQEVKDVVAIDRLTYALGNLAGCLPGEDLMERQSWPADPARVEACLEGLRETLELSLPIIEGRNQKLCAELEGIGERLKELSRAILLLENNQSPLQENPQKLIRFLKDRGIDAMPLCDLVDVKKEEWRETIESILGNVREALIIDPDQVREAVRLYRNEGRREFPGCHIVNTMQTDAWLNPRKDNSLAEYFVTENTHARAFLNRRLGTIVCVDSEEDLLNHDRAVTVDGMFSMGGTITELRSVDPILGHGSRKALLERYKREQKDLNNQKIDFGARQKQFTKLSSRLGDFETKFPAGRPLPMAGLVKQRNDAAWEVGKLRSELEALSRDTREEDLQGEIEALEDEAEGVDAEYKEWDGKYVKAKQNISTTKKELEALESHLDILQKALKDQRDNPLLDSAKAADMLDRWREKYGGNLNEICERANQEIKAATNSIEGNRRRIYHEYAEYHTRYLAEEGPDEQPPATFEEYAALIRKKKGFLVDTRLADYRDKSGRALQAAQEAFRSKFVSRLIHRLNIVRDLIHQLNKSLERTSFHGDETYKFHSNANPEFEHIIRFAEEVSKSGFTEIGGLSILENDPDSPHRKALDDISRALQDPREAERLQDYRNYLVFRVDILNKDGKVIGSLDHRIKKGSGGENQTPFYVAIGSSLSAAYRIRQGIDGKAYGGMNLVIFDEAFSKLSLNTCQQCANFLSRINLQMLVAAPDEKSSTMAAIMDQLIWVSREGGVVDVSCYYIKHAMRELLRSDNPYAASVGRIPESNLA